MNVESLYRMFKTGNISFEAPYQRGYVWTQEQKEHLIDSVIKWIPINAVYLNEYAENQPFEVVDGKQRLSTIFDFVEDGFTWEGYLFSELPTAYKGLIWGSSLALYKTNYKTVKQCEELYARINLTGTPHERP